MPYLLYAKRQQLYPIDMKIASGLVVIMIFGLIAIFFPYKGESKSSKSYEELNIEYKTLKLKFGLLLLVIAVLSTFLIKPILEFICLQSGSQDDSIFYIVPGANIWYAPAGILGIAISIYLTEYFGRLILKSRLNEYHHYTSLKDGVDGKKILIPLSWGLLLLATAVTWGYSNNFIAIRENGIVYHQLRTLNQKSYSYLDVEQIYFVENVKYDNRLVPEPHYYLKFSDGAVWSTRAGLSKEEQNEEIFEYISMKTGLELKTIACLNK
jgi:uncharacterized membrane protein YqhA